MDRRLIKAEFGFQNWETSEAAFHTMNHSWINNSNLPGWERHTDIFMSQSHSEPNQNSLQRNKSNDNKKEPLLKSETFNWKLTSAEALHHAQIWLELNCTFVIHDHFQVEQQFHCVTIGQKGHNLQISALPPAGLQVHLGLIIQLFLFKCCSKFHISVV